MTFAKNGVPSFIAEECGRSERKKTQRLSKPTQLQSFIWQLTRQGKCLKQKRSAVEPIEKLAWRAGNGTFRDDSDTPKGLNSSMGTLSKSTGIKTEGIDIVVLIISYLLIVLNCIHIHFESYSKHPKYCTGQLLLLLRSAH